MSGFSACFKGKHESKATKSTENELREERVQHREHSQANLFNKEIIFLRKKKKEQVLSN